VKRKDIEKVLYWSSQGGRRGGQRVRRRIPTHEQNYRRSRYGRWRLGEQSAVETEDSKPINQDVPIYNIF
jgi:hypothetical protein